MALNLEEIRRRLAGQLPAQSAQAQPMSAQAQAAQPQQTRAAQPTAAPQAPASVPTTQELWGQQPQKPVYANQARLDELFQQITNPTAFSFDLANNPTWKAYEEQYKRLGQLAMTDTMGQAAGLTGGYGSSYGQVAGQQQYNAYMEALSGKVPEIYEQERKAYDDDYARQLQLYGLMNDQANQEYSRWADDYDRWMAQYTAAQSQENWQKEMDFQREQWNWQKAQAAARSSGSGGSRGSSSGSSGSSGESGASGSGEEQNQPMTVFPGGYTENDIGGMAAAWVNNDGNVRGKYGTMDAFLRSLGVTDSGALTYAHDIIKHYGG